MGPAASPVTASRKRKGDGIVLMRYAPAKQKPMLGEEERTFHVVIE